MRDNLFFLFSVVALVLIVVLLVPAIRYRQEHPFDAVCYEAEGIGAWVYDRGITRMTDAEYERHCMDKGEQPFDQTFDSSGRREEQQGEQGQQIVDGKLLCIAPVVIFVVVAIVATLLNND